MRTDTAHALRDAVPVAAAIGVFGVIYGALATEVMTPTMAVASSLLVFSGVAQFTLLGLLEVDATTTAVVTAIAVLGLRHLPLAAVVRPHLPASRRRRAVLSLVLIDETVGLALARPQRSGHTMAVAGVLAWVAYAVGTLAGVLGADLLALAPLAGVVFLLLFTGLAALTAAGARDGLAAVVTAGATIGVLLVAPGVGALGAIGVALGVAAIATARHHPASTGGPA